MKPNRLFFLLTLFVFSNVQAADKFERDNVYVGGGIGFNSVGKGGDSIGFQFLAGYDLEFPLADGVNSLVEVGYMDSGSFDNGGKATGFWGTGLATYRINKEILALGRIGLDIGDDSGLMLGFGADYKLDKLKSVRGEIVKRDSIDSIQFNFTYKLN
ncbi:MAG: porin family protein [Gammaproteobacteria bacterium]|nr:porin family protein [Gammaproteobacteria bacterium]